MGSTFRAALLAGACHLAVAAAGAAHSEALVVVGTSGGGSVAEDLDTAAADIRTGLIARGLAAGTVVLLADHPGGERVTAAQVLDHLRAFGRLSADDELILGTSGRSCWSPSGSTGSSSSIAAA
jgi:hypothetical protein